MDNEEFIHKSPATLVIKIVTAEALTEVVYVMLHTVLHMLEVSTFAFDVNAVSALLNVVMSLVAVFMFIIIAALWASEGVYIRKEEIVSKYGLLKTKYSSYPYVNMQRVVVNQGILGKIFNFGTVTVYVPVLGMDIRFTDMPSPNQFAERLKAYIVKPYRQRYIIQR